MHDMFFLVCLSSGLLVGAQDGASRDEPRCAVFYCPVVLGLHGGDPCARREALADVGCVCFLLGYCWRSFV